jgi:hypothetical protein
MGRQRCGMHTIFAAWQALLICLEKSHRIAYS